MYIQVNGYMTDRQMTKKRDRYTYGNNQTLIDKGLLSNTYTPVY